MRTTDQEKYPMKVLSQGKREHLLCRVFDIVCSCLSADRSVSVVLLLSSPRGGQSQWVLTLCTGARAPSPRKAFALFVYLREFCGSMLSAQVIGMKKGSTCLFVQALSLDYNWDWDRSPATKELRGDSSAKDISRCLLPEPTF